MWRSRMSGLMAMPNRVASWPQLPRQEYQRRYIWLIRSSDTVGEFQIKPSSEGTGRVG